MIASGMKKNTPAPNNVVSIFTCWPSPYRCVVPACRRGARGPCPAVAPSVAVLWLLPRLLQLRAAADPRQQAGVRRGDAGRRGLRVVQVESRPLGADARQREEVVPRRGAARRPLQRGTVAPRVVDLDLGVVARDPHV